jgi:predicted DNA-binding ribbon-helix-helix protein
MKSTIVKHTIEVAGHKTSLSLEDAFWLALKDIAWSRRMTLRDLVGGIYSNRTHGNLSSAVRLFVLNYYKERAEMTAPDANSKEKFRPQLALLNGVT